VRHKSELVRELREAGLRSLEARLAQRETHLSLTGLMGPARQLAEALLVAEAAGPALLIVADERRLADASADLSTFFGFIGRPREVLPFPAIDTDPYRGLAPHFDVAAARARALAALAERAPVMIVAPAAALLFRTAQPALLAGAVLNLAAGQSWETAEVERCLLRAGYLREDPVVAPGEFARRGGIVDVFPPELPEPVRLEFEGEVIEEMRTFDPATQRARNRIDAVKLRPAREWILSEADRNRLLAALMEAGKEEKLLPKFDRESFPAGAAFALPLLPEFQATLFDYLGSAPVLVEEPADVERNLLAEWERILGNYDDALDRGSQPACAPAELLLQPEEVGRMLSGRSVGVEEMAVIGTPGSPVHIPSQIFPSFRGRVGDFVEEVRRQLASEREVRVFAAHRGLAERWVEIFQEARISAGLADGGPIPEGAVALELGDLTRSFLLPGLGQAFLSGRDVFSEPPRPERRAARKLGRFLSDFRDLKTGDFVVHTDHGIGVFTGLKQMPQDGGLADFVVLEYQGRDRLYVPVERLDLLEKYSSAESTQPRLDKLGGTGWERVKSRVRKSMRDMAAELLQLYAARRAITGHRFSPDTHWQKEFEDLFEYQETEDQIQTIEEVKRDMEREAPMDRLVCGDVGYGKTEVAMRAAFKAVMDGKQVAILVPTTVLAFQHFNTLRARFAPFPVRVEMISRFRSPKEIKAVLADLAAGAVDVLIGTHRLLGKDVVFKDLGLLVVDEEQRFGVAHKERLKQLRRNVDSLTMTATPIPRTLHMSLAGIRDMSVIETPPKDRMAIQTYLTRFDGKVLAEAIRHELARGGQVYFVHNRVESIYTIAAYLKRLVPEARFGIAHGQMKESELEKTMLRFIRQEFDVLVSTTIIENGLDIPLVNTLIVNRAERFGLAQLYQLRGRVGRSNRRAYAYLLVPEGNALNPIARRRLAAIREFSDLGAGFRIAALDLELRGAGNLLGGEQHGHIEAVGFDLYCKLLEQTVRELSGAPGEAEAEPARPSFNLKVDLRISDAYIPDVNQRMSIYKRVSSARDGSVLARIAEEIRDRYGPLPAPVLQLIEYARLRLLAEQLRIVAVEREERVLSLRFDAASPLDPAKLVELTRRRPGAQLTPGGVLKLPLGDTGPQELLSAVKEILLELLPYSREAAARAAK
jgi:transcription-repair coupling factor (superfamily II helicase)